MLVLCPIGRSHLKFRCMPSSQNSVIMLQKENRSDLAASMAGTLAVVYLLSAVPIAILLSAIREVVGI